MLASGGSDGVLGGNQMIDFGTEVREHEVPGAAGFSLVDFLGPVFERNGDAELLIDGEDRVEEVQTIDVEILRDVAVMRDLVPRNVADLGNSGFSRFGFDAA